MKPGHARSPHLNPLPPAGEEASESLRELCINQPLSGKRIVVTRPREQATRLTREIERLGGKALLVPLLQIAPAADQAALQEQLARIAQFDLAIFISPNAVQYGMAAIEAAGGLPPALKIATVGQGSARALHERGSADIIAPTERFDSEGLLALPQLQDVSGWHVLIFRGDGGRELLGNTLKARGATVEYVTCYQRSKPRLDVVALLDDAPDAITVTSSEALNHLAQMLDDKARTVIFGMPLFVPHQRIADLARRQGWKQVLLTGAGDDGLVSGLLAWARQRAKSRGQRAATSPPGDPI